MSKNGVFQLTNVAIKYFLVDRFGKRDFIVNKLPELAKSNPQISFEVVKRAGRHPYMLGKYLSGKERSVDLKNKSPEEVEQSLLRLRGSWGNKARKISESGGVITSRPSIQGFWKSSGLMFPEKKKKLE